jgi:hypothetical protein
MITATRTAQLTFLLNSLANGSAQRAVEDAHEDNYPVCYDPETGVLVVSEDN